MEEERHAVGGEEIQSKYILTLCRVTIMGKLLIFVYLILGCSMASVKSTLF